MRAGCGETEDARGRSWRGLSVTSRRRSGESARLGDGPSQELAASKLPSRGDWGWLGRAKSLKEASRGTQ